jgi:hypothetical protein
MERSRAHSIINMVIHIAPPSWEWIYTGCMVCSAALGKSQHKLDSGFGFVVDLLQFFLHMSAHALWPTLGSNGTKNPGFSASCAFERMKIAVLIHFSGWRVKVTFHWRLVQEPWNQEPLQAVSATLYCFELSSCKVRVNLRHEVASSHIIITF